MTEDFARFLPQIQSRANRRATQHVHKRLICLVRRLGGKAKCPAVSPQPAFTPSLAPLGCRRHCQSFPTSYRCLLTDYAPNSCVTIRIRIRIRLHVVLLINAQTAQ